MLLNYDVGEVQLWCWTFNPQKSLGQQGDQTSQSKREWTLNIHWKDWHWSWRSNTLATWDVKSRLTGKHPDVGKDWRQNEKGVAEDEMVGEHHWLNGHEFEQTPGDSGGQRSLVCHILGVTKSQTWLSNWMTTISLLNSISTTLSAKWISMPKCSIVSLH